MPIREENRRAFSLVELMLIVAFLGVFAAIAIPRLDYGIVRRYKAEATAKKILTSLRLTRSFAISDAATNDRGFALRFDGPGGSGVRTGYEIMDRDTQPPTVAREYTIDPDVTVTSDKKSMRFGPLGNILESPSGGFPSEITASADGKIFTIGFLIGTGTITCTEN